jgi:hypothetical protein
MTPRIVDDQSRKSTSAVQNRLQKHQTDMDAP